MLRRVLKLTTSPRTLLRSVLALDDSPHAIALGVAIGIFVGLTPSVGIQTVLVLALIFICRPFFYFNGTAAMASTYVSNPLTMAPMYYFWYRLGAWFLPNADADVNFDALLQFEGLAGWWESTSTLAVQVGFPMLIGALLTAPFGAAIAYPLTHHLVRWFRNSSGAPPSGSGETLDKSDRVDESHASSSPPNSVDATDRSAATTISASTVTKTAAGQ